jgi:hypothetical protein
VSEATKTWISHDCCTRRATVWFVTAQFVSVDGSDADPRPMLCSPAHAKQMGSPFTACGLNAASWRRLWELQFDADLWPRCATCDAIVRNGKAVGLADAPSVTTRETFAPLTPGGSA